MKQPALEAALTENFRINRVSGGFSVKDSLKKMNRFAKANFDIPWEGGRNSELKGKIALEAGWFYKDEIRPHLDRFSRMSQVDIGLASGLLEAADYADPAGNLGTLSGTLVMLRALDLYAFDYPELGGMFNDFSDEPGLFEQTEDTRIISIPAVQSYNTAIDAAGRPQGWSTVSPAVTQDAPVTLSAYIGVPIVFSQATISATRRDLFGEQMEAGMKAVAGYWIGLVTKLLTPANFDAYVAVTAPDANGVIAVPTAYTTYARSISDFSMTDLDKLSAIFTQNKVPRSNRGILLSTNYYAKLRSDPRLEFFFAATGNNPVLTEQKLPQGLSGFFPYEAPYLPQTNNLQFFPFHRSGIILKARLPADFSSLGVMVPGKVSTITNPDTKLSVALVQYVNLTQNYSECRPEVMIGASLGDARGGLLGASQ